MTLKSDPDQNDLQVGSGSERKKNRIGNTAFWKRLEALHIDGLMEKKNESFGETFSSIGVIF